MKQHEFVPLPLIKQIANMPSTDFILDDLHRLKLVKTYNHSNYTLTYLGHDYIALTALKNKNIFDLIGLRIGVGKEADVYIARNSDKNEIYAVKFHKLGLTSFQTAKTKRNYLGSRVNASWMKMSELSAKREYGYLKVLSERGFPCPRGIALNRQCVVMDYIDGVKMNKLSKLTQQQANELGWQVWVQQMTLLSYGVIHGDLNEYNVILKFYQDSDCGNGGDAQQCDQCDQQQQQGDEQQNEQQDEYQQEQEQEQQDVEDDGDTNNMSGNNNDDNMVGDNEYEEECESDDVDIDAHTTNTTTQYNNNQTSVLPVKEYTINEVKELYQNYKNKKLSFAELFVIDFPQMINSTDKEAEEQFDRDCDSYENFLNRRFQAQLQLPRFKYVKDLYVIKPEEKIDTSEKAVNQYCTDVTKQQMKKKNVYQRVLLEKNQKMRKDGVKQFKEKKRNYKKVKNVD